MMKKLIASLLILFTASSAWATNPTGSAYQVFTVPSGGGLAKFGQVNLAQSAAVTGLLPPANGGTGQNFSSSTGLVRLNSGTAFVANIPPAIQSFTSAGSGTYALSYAFIVSSANATAGATYTNNTVTFTVETTISSGTLLYAHGTGAPTASGTLTKASGTGDATITFSAVATPTHLRIRMIGAGGGGGASISGGTGGGNTTWNSTLLVAGGGGGAGTVGGAVGAGGTNSATSGPIIIVTNTGAAGGPSQYAPASTTTVNGGEGGASGFAGFGAGGRGASQAGYNVGNAGYSGPGGGAGGFLEAQINSPAASYSYVVGALGGGGAGAGSGAGNASGGKDGAIFVEARFQ